MSFFKFLFHDYHAVTTHPDIRLIHNAPTPSVLAGKRPDLLRVAQEQPVINKVEHQARRNKGHPARFPGVVRRGGIPQSGNSRARR